MISIRLLDASGAVLFGCEGENHADLVIDHAYAQGDTIVITTTEKRFLDISVDAAVPSGCVFLKDYEFRFAVPSGEPLTAYAPGAFSGTRHRISARAVPKRTLANWRNLAFNPVDRPEATGAYPHISANAETRGESVFASRNVIDGSLANHSHGEWPYESWGVDISFDPVITIDFGRPVAIDTVALILRADFPHDSWWTHVTLELSDGTETVLPIEKTDDVQYFKVGYHTVTGASLKNLIKKDEPAEFPALIEWEIYGSEAVLGVE